MFRLKERYRRKISKLDGHFKELLIHIRPYVLSLKSAKDIELCKLWINKLRYATTQRELRIAYLNKLFQELKKNKLQDIFSKPPPAGYLRPLSKQHNKVVVRSPISDLSDVCTIPGCNYSKSNIKNANECLQSKITFNKSTTDSSSSCTCTRTPKTVKFQKREHEDQSQLNNYKTHINNLISVLRELQTKNKQLNQELTKYKGRSKHEDAKHLQYTIKQLTAEILTLRTKLTEVQKLKDTLESNHKYVVQQCNLQMNEQFKEFKAHLNKAQSENMKLYNDMTYITQKLDEIKQEKVQLTEHNCMEKINSAHEIYEALLKEKDAEIKRKDYIISRKGEELTDAETKRKEEIKHLNERISDLEIKLKMKFDNEDKLETLLTTQYSSMMEEFNAIKENLQKASQKENEDLNNKVMAMKRTIFKLERSKEKCEYEKRIFRLLLDKELEIKFLQLQLQAQRSDISSTLNLEKQCEINHLVSTLEEKYKTHFSTVNASGDDQRKYCFLKPLFSPMLKDDLAEQEHYV